MEVNGANLSQIKQQYLEAKRTNDTQAMNEAKRQAMQAMSKQKPSEDTVEISEQAMNEYQNIK